MPSQFPADEWQYQPPATLGFDERQLTAAFDAISRFNCIGAMAIRNGVLVGSVGAVAEKSLVRSVRKSLLSALIGIAVEREQILLSATIADLDIDDVDRLTEAEKRASVLDLLTSRSGVYHPALAETRDAVATKPPRGSAAPGEKWVYNNWDFNALGTIYERATGKSVYQGLLDDIATPIGMQDYSPADGHPMRGEISNHPAYHVALSTRDMARFGLLYLNNGRWGDRQIVPADWVRESTSAHSIARNQGYGYMWWTTGLAGEAETLNGVRRNADLPPFRYAAQGHHGQLIYIVPQKDLVVVSLSAPQTRAREEWSNYWDFIRLTILSAQ